MATLIQQQDITLAMLGIEFCSSNVSSIFKELLRILPFPYLILVSLQALSDTYSVFNQAKVSFCVFEPSSYYDLITSAVFQNFNGTMFSRSF